MIMYPKRFIRGEFISPNDLKKHKNHDDWPSYLKPKKIVVSYDNDDDCNDSVDDDEDEDHDDEQG
jgi:hypothetical protein